MSSRPWYKWFPSDFLSDTRMLSLEEQGAYRALLDHLWINGPFEPTTANLRRIWGVDTRVVRRIYAVLRPYLTDSYGLCDHPKLAEQRREVSEKKEKARKAGKKGGEANAKANALATRARARAHPRPQSDPDRSKPTPKPQPKPISAPNPDARARDPGGGLTPEQRAEAERIDAMLAEKRRNDGLAHGEAGGALRPIAAIAGRVVGGGKA